MKLEQIVKKNVPFTGQYRDRHGPHSKGRLIIPSDLAKILRERQNLTDGARGILFYRFYLEEIPQYLELTDDINTDEASFYTHSNMDGRGRVLVNIDNLGLMQISRSTNLIYVGGTNRILIYRQSDYDSVIGRRRRTEQSTKAVHPTL